MEVQLNCMSRDGIDMCVELQYSRLQLAWLVAGIVTTRWSRTYENITSLSRNRDLQLPLG